MFKFPGEVSPSESVYRTILDPHGSLPEVSLRRYGVRSGFVHLFHILECQVPVGTVDLAVHARLFRPYISMIRRNWVKSSSKGVGLAAYLLVMESVAARGSMLQSGTTLNNNSLRKWEHFERVGLATCENPPRELTAGEYLASFHILPESGLHAQVGLDIQSVGVGSG